MGEQVFNIKVISNSHLVLVECKGFNAEIFKPEITDGKIHLKNIVKGRRCCEAEVLTDAKNKINIINIANLKKVIPLTAPIKPILCSTLALQAKKSRVSATNVVSAQSSSNSFQTSRSISRSSKSDSQLSQPDTLRDAGCYRSPARNWRFSGLHSSDGTGQPGLFAGPNISTAEHHPIFKTPQKVTETVPTFATPRNIPSGLNKSMKKLSTPRLGPGIKVIRLHRKHTEGTPRKVAKIVPLDPSFKENVICSTPKNTKTLNKSIRQPTPGTVTKWRKCLTPAKTYSRRSNQRNKEIIRSVKKSNKKPKYLTKSTVGRQGNAILKIQRVSVKIDGQTAIGVAEFKNQMRTADELKKRSVSEIKTREDLFNAKYVSFDLLTNPTRKRCFSKKLRSLFRKRCVQKFTFSDPKYKHLLDNIPPLTEIHHQRKRYTI